MRSLSLKLIGAFALVILVGAAITYVVAAQTVDSQFRLYVSQRGQLRAESWATLFANYYAQAGSWNGVERLLADLPITITSPGMMGQGRGGPRSGQGQASGSAGTPGGHGMGSAAEDHVILADADGRVVLDSQGVIIGQTLPPNELAQGAPVIVDGKHVGTLLVVTPSSGPSAVLASDFLTALNQGVLLAAVVAGLVALLLGALLVQQIIAPLRRLQSAAHAIASGDLSQRVATTSRDEVGEVSRAFNRMAESLEDNERLRRHMMADIAHELRTPLTVVQGQVEALLDGVFPLTPEQLVPIHDETLLLSRLVADLRDLALAEAGQLTIEHSPVNLGDLARRVVAAVEPVAAEKDIALALDVSPNLPTISADPDRLNQVLHNLLSNALRHTPTGGQITVSVRRATEEDWKAGRLEGWKREGVTPTSNLPTFQPSNLPVSQSSNLPIFQPSNPPLLVSVADTGPGIPAEDLPHIFDRFYRADKSRSRAGGGSGLGLTIARYIVEAHRGRIWAESREGAGTRIGFTLPISSPGVADQA
ncbi:MAG: ATP-binding protein [Anaerolineae bacterium]